LLVASGFLRAFITLVTCGVACGCARPQTPVEVPMISADAALAASGGGAPESKSSPPMRLGSGDAPFERGDRLRGHYWCAQGRTELTLVIEDVDGEAVSGIFEFDYPGGGTTDPANGSFRVRGALDASTPSGPTLRLDGVRWIEQPDGYMMVGLVGTVSKTGSISGTVKGAGCTTFYLDSGKRRRTADHTPPDE